MWYKFQDYRLSWELELWVSEAVQARSCTGVCVCSYVCKDLRAYIFKHIQTRGLKLSGPLENVLKTVWLKFEVHRFRNANLRIQEYASVRCSTAHAIEVCMNFCSYACHILENIADRGLKLWQQLNNVLISLWYKFQDYRLSWELQLWVLVSNTSTELYRGLRVFICM